MTLLACIGDLHIGSGKDLGRELHGPASRLQEQRGVWETTCSRIAERRPDAVLFAGDAFERPKPSPAENIAFRGGLAILEAAGVPVLAVPGNHDVSTIHEPTALDIFATPFFGCERTPGLHELASGLVVATIPWAPPTRVIAAAGGEQTRTQSLADVARFIVEAAAGLRGEGADVLLAHWSVSGAVFANGQAVDAAREVVLAGGDLEGLGFTAVVLGHIHKRQSLWNVIRSITPAMEARTGPAFYTGSLCKQNFGEEHLDHGITWLEIDEDGAGFEFEPVRQRKLLTLDLTADEAIAFSRPVLDLGHALTNTQALEGADGAVVRVRYAATEAEHARVDVGQLRQNLIEEGAFKVYQVAPTIARETRARVEAVDETIDDAAALDAYLEHSEEDADVRLRARELAGEYLR